MKMQSGKRSMAGLRRAVVSGAILSIAPLVASGQTPSGTSDAQVEANVLKALASAPELSTQDIQSSTAFGVVTLSGTVQNETLRTRAETLVSRTSGVKKVVDEMALGTPSQAGAAAPAPGSDSGGTQAEDAYSPAEPATPYAGPPPQPAQEQNRNVPPPAAQPPYPTQASNGSQPAYSQAPYGQPPAYNQQPAYGQQPAPGTTYPPGYGQPQPGTPYGAQQGYPPQQGYAPQPGYAPQGGQPGGVVIVIPGGALLRVRVNRGIDSNHIQPGTPWDGTVLNDVAAGGMIAIPRGASVQGVVVDSKKAGALKGEGELSLQVTHVQMGGSIFPVTSDLWAREGADKSVRTVNSALGLGVLGAIVGGVAGGGAGAAVGAGVGAGVGVAGSAASPGGRVIVPPEAVLTFHLAQPAQVVTVSEQEMQRLAYAAGPGAPVRPVVRRRYYPGYYGPGYYPPAPYPYPY